ncbi:phage tail assembly chaperone [Sphingopyxis sp.]|uniref:phage tail assembly chaperone n=1 Tax=Sphingopyxis sp. TaxID=1908224 RepID=UPI003D151FC1
MVMGARGDAHPAATSERVRKSRGPSREREARVGPVAIKLLGVMARVAGWQPGDFWAATPADVRAALGGWVEADADASFDGATLAALMEQFPDG